MDAYKSLDKIVEQISFYISQLNAGKLSATEIDDLLAEVAQLQERLIILRYKAFEEQVKDRSLEEIRLEKPISFSVKHNHPQTSAEESSPQQISLIDAIEAVETRESATETISAAIEENKPGITPLENQAPVPATVDEPVSNVVAANEPQAKIHEEITLAEKLQRTPVSDLKKVISLNQKFVFINELFRQNADDYHASIEQLNNFDELEEAMRFIKEQLVPLYNWDIESENVELFLDLVERRYL